MFQEIYHFQFFYANPCLNAPEKTSHVEVYDLILIQVTLILLALRSVTFNTQTYIANDAKSLISIHILRCQVDTLCHSGISIRSLGVNTKQETGG